MGLLIGNDMTDILQFYTTRVYNNDLTEVNIKWSIQNEEVHSQANHANDFIIGDSSVDDIETSYASTAEQAIYEVIDSKFPGRYILNLNN